MPAANKVSSPHGPTPGGNADFPQATLDHYKEAFSAYEDSSKASNATILGIDVRPALADCGIILSQQDIQDQLIPLLPASLVSTAPSGAKALKPVNFKQFLEIVRKAIPLGQAAVKPADEDAGPSPSFVDDDEKGGSTVKRLTRRQSRRDSATVRDSRSENARKLEKLQDIRERLADLLSSTTQQQQQPGNGDNSAPPPPQAESSVEQKEEQFVNEAIAQLDLLGCPFLVEDVTPTKNAVNQQQQPPPTTSSASVLAAGVVAFIDKLISSLSAAVASEVEYIEAYSADDLLVDSQTLMYGKSLDSSGSRGQKLAEIDALKQKQLLQDLEEFTFSNSGDPSKKQGSGAFRTKVRDFPFFMFPIDSVCSRLDALDELQEQYEQCLKGKEFLLIPKCVDGRRCRMQDVPEHRLKFSHPCYAEEIPCPHRHRSLHMKCYSHEEDDNPDFEVKLKSLQKRLGVIELTGMELGDCGSQCLAFVLQQDRHREGKPMYAELLMSGNHISPGGAVSLLESCQHLVHVDLSGNSLGYKTVALMQTSSIGQALQALLTRSDRLVSLNLSRNRLSDRDGRYIAEGLKTNTALRHLDLRKNELGATFGADMAAALAENRDLRELYIGWNRLESSGSAILLQEMKTSSTLEIVDMSWTGISDEEGARAVAEMIAGSMALKTLYISHNNIGPDGCTAISKALVGNKTLQYLDVSFNPLGSKATSELVKDIKDNVSLEVLDIRCVKAGEEVTEDIKRLMKTREPKMQQHGLKMSILFSTSIVGGGNPHLGRGGH